MLIFLKRCCVDVNYRLLKQKKGTKKLQKNNCCWYIETKLFIFVFSAVCCVHVFYFYQNIFVFCCKTFVLEYFIFLSSSFSYNKETCCYFF
jgi:hypothetical protein